MMKLKAIFHLLFAKSYYIYTDGQRQFKNMTVQDITLINNDTADVVTNEIQAQVNVNAVNEMINS